jgi:hypothetical protein
MSRLSRAWILSAVCALACDTEVTPSDPGGAAGSAGSTSTAGTASAGSNVGGSASPSGGSATATAGNAGLGGTSTGGSSAGTGGSAAGQSQGGSAGNSGGSGGSGGAANPSLPKRVLLYSFSTLVINSVPQQLTLLETQLKAWGYEVERSVKPDDVSTTNLARFGGVGMINTCFEPFGKGSMGDAQTAALKAFVEGGGGLFGTHCASVTFQSAQPAHPYNALLGGRGGKDNYDGKSACTTTAEQHPSTAMLPATFDYTGNLDDADYLADDTKVLVKCKWSGGQQKDTAVSWYRTPGKGRVFFTNFAKVDADLSDATLGQKHILLGLGWTLGR